MVVLVIIKLLENCFKSEFHEILKTDLIQGKLFIFKLSELQKNYANKNNKIFSLILKLISYLEQKYDKSFV